MSLEDAQDKVRDFHQKYGYAKNLLHELAPSKEWAEVGMHRAHLINEELAEMLAAWANRDVTKIADGLVDLLYVVLGTGVAAGIDLAPLFDEVHRSNMTKDVPSEFVLHPHKGKNYSPPNLWPILREQGLIE